MAKVQIKNATIKSYIKKAFDSLGDLPVSLILRRKGVDSYDPATGRVAGSLPQEWPCRGVIAGIKETNQPGSSTLTSQKQAIIEADSLPVVPAVNDFIVQDGLEWLVLDVDPVRPGSQTFLYRLPLKING